MKKQVVLTFLAVSILLYSSCNDSDETPVITTFTPALKAEWITSGCQIKSEGVSPVTAFGICWSTNPNPTLQDKFTKSVPGPTKTSQDTITGFAYNTKYYVRAYATNSAGTSYGEQREATVYLNFPEANLTDIDGNVYKTIRIGEKIWMMENLKTTKFRNGDPIPNVTDQPEWANLTTSAYCNFNNDIDMVSTYGRLYNSFAMEDTRKIAPAGWRVPKTSDWEELMDFLAPNCHDHLMETGTSHWITGNATADNISGFTALPAGHRDRWQFGNLGYQAYFWNDLGFRMVSFGVSGLNDCNSFVDGGGIDISGFSIRCIKE